MAKGFLLDTHALLWFLEGNPNLSKKAKNEILNVKNACYLSIVSLWEIAIKLKISKLKLEIEFQELAELLFKNNINVIQISFDHIVELLALEDHHGDPFDKIIISQAIFEKLTVLSKDKNFKEYKNLKLKW